MSRLFLSAAVLFSIFVSLLIMPPATEARRRCDDTPPETLLSLYRVSTEIHIGKFDRVEDGAAVEDTDDYTVVDILKHYSISTTLKGTPRKFHVVSETDYRYKGTGSEEPAVSEDEHGGELVEEIQPGDDVLIFLKPDEESGVVGPAHYRDAIRKLAPETVSGYETAVRELNSIFSAKKVDEAEIVAWLVRAALDPVTRWDGAFELLSGYQSTEWRREREEYIAGKIARGEKLEEWEQPGSEDADEFDPHAKVRTAYVSLVTEAQKRALLDAAIERRSEEGEDGAAGLPKLSEADRTLLDLVSRWGDNKLASYVIDQLRGNPAEQPYQNSQLMALAAKALGSKPLADLSDEYANLYYEDGEPLSDADAAIYQAEQPVADEGPAAARLTYGELRSKLFAKFISLAEELLTTAAR